MELLVLLCGQSLWDRVAMSLLPYVSRVREQIDSLGRAKV